MNCSIIRKWRLSDASDLAIALNNKKILDNLRDGIPFPYTQADAAAFIGEMLNSDPDQIFAFAITADGKAVGSVALYRGNNVHFRTAELGYYLAEPYWGKGIATRAVGEACRYVFENTDILRIFAEPFAYNSASCRVLEKNGFLHEGTLKCNAVKNGTLLDMQMYALIKSNKY